MTKAFKTLAREGERDYGAVKRYLETKFPLKALSPAGRKKLFDWAERFWKKEVEKVEEEKEREEKVLRVAEDILQDPQFTFTDWLDLSQRVAKKLNKTSTPS